MKEKEDGSLIVQEIEKAIQSILNLEPKLEEITKLEVEYIDNIDSTNINPKHWDRMADVIAQKYHDYDGFVITHGTDTMGYTASALSFALQNLGKPIICTGAQIPGTKIETDARRNFVNAVRLSTMDISGVMVVFDEEIISGTRASKVSESKLNAFKNTGRQILGKIVIDFRLSDEHKPRHDNELKVMKGFEPNIAVYTMTPGFPVEILTSALDNNIKGIILRSYGPGNIAYEYLESIKKANNMKIPIMINTQCLEGATAMHLYDVGKQALDLGCIQAYDMNIETVTTKLMWALKHFSYEEIKDVMHKNYVGEINVEGKI